MKLKTKKLKADGFNRKEIRKIQAYCDTAESSGTFNRDAALVQLTGEPEWCCRTVAEIMDELRPGSWLDRGEEATSSDQRRAGGKSGKKAAAIREFAMKSDDGNLIKVHYAYPLVTPGGPRGEFLFARRINKNTAKIDSIPFLTAALACGDLVRFNKDREITKVLEHVAKTRLLIYADAEEDSEEEIEERYDHIQKELKQYDVYTEGMLPGVCAISVPKDIDDEELESIANRLDVEVVIHEDEVEEETDVDEDS